MTRLPHPSRTRCTAIHTPEFEMFAGGIER